MDIWYIIITFTIAGLIVFATAYFILKTFMRNEQKKRETDIRAQTLQATSPIKIQAYERLVLFLERINPESLLVRVQSPHMNTAQLHSDLLTTIRAEFEHNLSQQIYVSAHTWNAIKQTKEHIIKIINSEASHIDSQRPASDLSQAILHTIMNLEENPITITIDILKIEAGNFI